MVVEVATLGANNTWTLTSLPDHKKPIGCKWVYKVKHRANGSIERFTARLVARVSPKERVWTIQRHFP